MIAVQPSSKGVEVSHARVHGQFSRALLPASPVLNHLVPNPGEPDRNIVRTSVVFIQGAGLCSIVTDELAVRNRFAQRAVVDAQDNPVFNRGVAVFAPLSPVHRSHGRWPGLALAQASAALTGSAASQTSRGIQSWVGKLSLRK